LDDADLVTGTCGVRVDTHAAEAAVPDLAVELDGVEGGRCQWHRAFPAERERIDGLSVRAGKLYAGDVNSDEQAKRSHGAS
jgi:hypothetical protein